MTQEYPVPSKDRATPEHPSGPAGAAVRVPLWHRVAARIMKTLLPIAILAAGGYWARDIYLSAPALPSDPGTRIPRLVEVATVEPVRRGPLIEAWGAVAPARKLKLSPEVSGRVVALHPDLTPGGRIAAGAELVRLDDRAFRLEIAEAEAEIRRIDAQIQMEAGKGQRAERDLARLRSELTEAQKELVLRKPQMQELQAERAAAVARRDAARLERTKTRITAPFDALVISEQVAPGAMLASGDEIATLVATERFHVYLAVPPSALDWIAPEAGQTIRLAQPGVWEPGQHRTGRISRVKPGLTETGRMAELVVEVEDPLARRPENAGKPPLLIGSYIRARIEGRAIAGAVAIDRAWLRDGSTVWVMTEENRLDIRRVEIAWRGAEEVLVRDGLAPGERVVTTHLATVADGMALRLASSEGGQ